MLYSEIKIPLLIYKKISEKYGAFLENISGISGEKIINDVLSFNRANEQFTILKEYLSEKNLLNKKLLEIGSGYGIFQILAKCEYGIDAWGIEPSATGFDDSFDVSRQILNKCGLPNKQIINAVAEYLPFHDNYFDIIYSSNALEHTQSPEKVINEAIRVCKPGGIIQIVTPNYGSFFDGHYVCFYIPYQPKWFWKLWIKFILKRDPDFANTLRTEINYFSINHWLKKHLQKDKIEVLSYGEEIFKERVMTGFFSDWAGLGKVKRWIYLINRLKLTFPFVYILLRLKAYSPIILTIRKK